MTATTSANFVAPPPLAVEQRWRRRGRVLALVTMGGMFAGAGYLFAFDPTEAPMPKCVFHELTGLHCPGCGTTRALHALLHGHVIAALGFNPLFVLALPVMAVAVIRQGVMLLAGVQTRPLGSGLSGSTIRLIAIVIVGFGVVRNFPWWPFTLLAP